MRRRKLFWHIFPLFLLVSAFTLLAAGVLVLKAMGVFHVQQVREDLEARARMLAPQARQRIQSGETEELNQLALRLGAETATRITIIAADGRVLAESNASASLMENHADREEVREALESGTGSSVRSSDTVLAGLVYVAVAIPAQVAGAPPLGVVRMAIPLTAVRAQMASLRNTLLLIGLLTAALVALLSWWISRMLSRPLEAMRHAAERFAGGDLRTPMPRTRTEEIAALAEAVREMAYQLNERVRNEARQLNEKQGVLSSMVEGVIAVDSGERLLNINAAAARLIGLDDLNVHGRSIQEVIRNTELQRFIQRALASPEPVEGDLVLYGERQRYLRATGTLMHDVENQPIGTVVVLHDMTRLRQLERLRREFVANVSHELRTPITSIKGFAETLLESTGTDPAENERFLRIIARQADRLNSIIEDLLALARIEQDHEHGELNRSTGSLRETLASAIQICALKAEEKQIRIELICDDAHPAEMNGPLIEQAVVNLIDNAIKYSEPGTAVQVRVEPTDTNLLIHVRDEGCGVEARHLPRLFERFYRVDKARSRKLGGTGLGLAIVKHIAEAHGGRTLVESTPRKGSTFTIELPRRRGAGANGNAAGSNRVSASEASPPERKALPEQE